VKGKDFVASLYVCAKMRVRVRAVELLCVCVCVCVAGLEGVVEREKERVYAPFDKECHYSNLCCLPFYGCLSFTFYSLVFVTKMIKTRKTIVFSPQNLNMKCLNRNFRRSVFFRK
jgi:hypothetical protein